MTTSPRFSIVIPTRNRAETLRHSLATAVTQEFDDFEVVVSDNHSSDETHSVVADIASARVRYVRAERALAMSDNWELALANARGEYVMIIGDDDGILPGGLAEADRILREAPADVIRFESAVYWWPTVPIEKLRNRLTIPIRRDDRMVDSRSTMMDVLEGRSDYRVLPMLYNAVVPRAIIDRIRSTAGRVFGDISPDIYSGFAVAYLAGSYASVARPIFVGGISGASTGYSMAIERGRTAIAQEYLRLNEEAGLPWHSHVPLVHSIRTFVAESFATLRDRMFANDVQLVLDRKAMVRRCVEDLPSNDVDEWRDGYARIRKTLDDDPSLRRWFDGMRFEPCEPKRGAAWYEWRRGFSGDELNLDASDFGVYDVAGAAAVARKVIGDPSSAALTWRPPFPERLSVRHRIRAAARILLRGR